MAKQSDITQPVDLAGHARGTGHLRAERPVYMDFMPPCNSACPAGENIQAWLDHAQAGDYKAAFYTIMQDNPFPAVMGRVCVKPCETGCNRNHIDTTVNIHAVERYIGDLAIAEKWPAAERKAFKTGKRIMVVGAGPGGLTAAYHLTLLGHEVEIFEEDDAPGGLLRWGVPEYRLPRQMLMAEIDRILALGIRLQVNYKIFDLINEKESRGFDAIYLSSGAHKIAAPVNCENQNFPVLDAMEFLKKVHAKKQVDFGEKVVVYGGNKLAMHIARVLKRLGFTPVVLYEGDRKTMQARDFEADDALDEGVEISFLHRITAVSGNTIRVEKMQLLKNKTEPTGEILEIEAGGLIWASRQEADDSLYENLEGVVTKPGGGIVIDASRMSGYAGIFAGGDMLPGEQKSSTTAIGHGKKAAKNIDAWLRGQTFEKLPKHPTAGYKRLHMWYQTEAPVSVQPRQHPLKASRNFDEVVAGISESDARYEAQRCLSCGNCFECDGCYGACPVEAIIKLGKGNRYKINYETCTGCGICVEQCPCHAMEMIAEPLNGSI